ncbi:ankyrin repeat domain-containing protein [Shewanella eurypsychrophilus]|uniref:Ankyrin repeat domain-containing protein n=1 Tax=Shewanella eurypsychrophilus TaxID=2593656 RepID=A0ABX6VAB9_9GAMM|nr:MULTISPECIES: ankyrin repeat domain-containing protein [Shewanella]QFU23185.1 hypothetical protein FS418_15815 [Shewanella sp. YLB-09]QPG58468.1 ankyrin repeat domain-containing protein [Shewanella eurypsychrophilus]
MKINRCFLILLSLLASLSAEAVDFSKSWFKPELIVNNAPICEDLLLQTKQIWNGSIFQIYPSSKMSTQRTDDVQINGKTVHLYSYTHSGCGGACERYQLLASNEPFPDRRADYKYYRTLLDESPSARNFHFLSSDDGSYYLFLPGKDLNQLYKLTENANWHHECSVIKAPSPEQILKVKSDYSEVQASLSELRGLIGGLRRGAGSSCGSMDTHWRWSSKIDDEFEKLLYAPRQKPKTEKRYDDSTYEIDLKNLELWSLQGLSEFDAFNQYKIKLATATNHLSKFYQKHFQWKEEEADEIADYALKSAISSGIRFYRYMPFNTSEEADLRRAILQKRPLEEIRKIDISGIDRSFDNKGWFKINESILNVAVKHPKAMSYLLGSGFDPNSQNVFDKTPLMYAAQYDGFDSARLLIEAGAEVNTGTIIPNDNCGYTLRTSNMSPLHYAVRYSSKGLIQLLIDNGASKFFDVRNGHNRPSTIEYPIDWLTRFDNESLTDDDKAEINQSLKLPGKDELANLTAELNLKGEKLYGEGKITAANDKFKEAIQVDNGNIRAINNFALTSLKLKDKQRSIQASTKIIESKKASDKQKASAYFNIGLACEGAGRYGLKFDGRRYCRQNSLEYLVKSYQAYPTKSRSNAIVNRFTKRDKAEFACKSNSTDFEAVYKRGKAFHFLHKKPMEQVISDVESVYSTNESFKIERNKFTLTFKELTELENGYSMSTYKSDTSIGEAFAFEGQVCSSLSSKLLPEKDKLVYVQAANVSTEVDIEFDLDKSYTIILSGNVLWKVSEVGSKKSDFIVNDGVVSDTSKVDFTALTKIHREWHSNANDNRYISSNIRSVIGKPIYTKFKIISNSQIIISDEDINRPKLIVNSFPTLDFYGYGDYQVAFTEPNIAFNNLMNLENIQLISSGPAQSGRDDQLYVPNINKYVDESEDLYFKVEKWRTGVGTYFGDGHFKK